MSFESFDEMATDCVDRDDLFAPIATFDVNDFHAKVYGANISEEVDQERAERELVESREFASNYCDICGKKVDGLVFMVRVRPWIYLHYCEEHYKTRSDYVKELALECIELTS